MLIPIERVRQVSSTRAEIVKEYVNPEAIQRVRENRVHEGSPTVDILVEKEWVRCLGTVEEVGHAVNEFANASGPVSTPSGD